MSGASQRSRWYRQSGPGLLVAAAFIGPGTVTVCTLAGVNFGYELLWALLLSVIATILLQEMSARIGLVTGKGLTEVIREQLNARPLLKVCVLTLIICAIVVGNAAYEAGNLSGGRLGLESALGLEQSLIGPWLMLLIGAAAFAILFSGSYRVLEGALTTLVVLMSLSFVTTAILTRPDPLQILNGLLLPGVSDANLLTIVGLIGTTVVPYNLFLHAALVREKWPGAEYLPAARRDTMIAVSLGGLVSMSILVSAAAADVAQVSNAGDLARSLEPLYGSAAKYLLGLGLFAAGITSAITAPLAAAYVVRGCMGWPASLQHPGFRAVWMLVLLTGVLFASLGINPIEIIRFAQVANGITLPVIAGIVLWLINTRLLPEQYRNTVLHNITGFAILMVTVMLGIRSLILVASTLLS